MKSRIEGTMFQAGKGKTLRKIKRKHVLSASSTNYILQSIINKHKRKERLNPDV